MALLNRTPRLFHTSKPFILSSTSLLRAYATTSNSPPRRAVTIVNDTGQTPWTALSKREKVARTTQQTLNLGIVALGFVMTGGVAYLLYTTVFSPDSKYSHFNRAVTEVKGNAECRELLGPAGKIRAYGESSWNRWSRNRAVAADVRKDGRGGEHFFMKFYVEGPDGKGTVNVHMVRPREGARLEYKTLSLDVPGHSTVYIRNTDAEAKKNRPSGLRFLGFEWK